MTQSEQQPVQPRVTITPYPDGPLIVRGAFDLCDLDGNPIERSGKAVALCRCGRSALKPFCDGSHKIATGPVVRLPSS
jgi:hypothetical protein